MSDIPKYNDNNYRHPGDFRAKDILLYSYGGSILDISNVTAVINLYQGLDTPFQSGNILFFDSMGATEQLPIIGNEFLEFRLRTPISAGYDEEVDASNHRFQVYEKRSVKTSQNIQAIALFFTSQEKIRNERLRVSKSISGSYGEMVHKLLKSDKELINTKKNVFIDPTAGKYKYTFPNVRPVEGIRQVGELSEPVNFRTPDYMFYENNRGFHFRCLESLYREHADTTKTRPFVAYFDLLSAFNRQFSTVDAEASSPMTKPYSFSFNKSYDTLGNTRRGMFGSSMYTHDLIAKTAVRSNLTYTSYYDRALHIDAPDGIGNKYQGVMPPGPADFDEERNTLDKSYGSTSMKQIDNLNRSKMSKASAPKRKYMDDYYARIYVTPKTKHNHKDNTHGLNLDPRLEQKRELSEATRDYFSMDVDVPGNFTYNVGDLVWCEVPSYNASYEDNESQLTREGKIDTLLSGRYLIQSLHHQVDFLQQKHTTAVTVVRNIFASDLPNGESFKSEASFRTKPVDVIGSSIDLSSGNAMSNILDLKIPTPQVSSVEDIAAKLGVDLKSTDLNVKNAANKAVNDVLNSTSNRVLQNKYLAKINSEILTRKTVVEKIAQKSKLQLGGINLSDITNLNNLKGIALDRALEGFKGRLMDNKFVQSSIVAFKQSNVFKSASKFFKGGGGGWGPWKSDIRYKENIELVGQSPSGINIYNFDYKGESGRYQGVMAQEVPWAAIVNNEGYYMVDYNKVDVAFKRIKKH